MAKPKKPTKSPLPPAFDDEDDYSPEVKSKLAALSARYGYSKTEDVGEEPGTDSETAPSSPAQTATEQPSTAAVTQLRHTVAPEPTASSALSEPASTSPAAAPTAYAASAKPSPAGDAAPSGHVTATPSPAGRPAHRQRKITFEVSDDLLHELEMEAARRRVSQRLLLVEGLAALGLNVPAQDRHDHRRRRRG